MEQVKKKPSREYFGLKRLIEIGSMASPLVVVFAVFIAPIFAESTSLLINYSNSVLEFGRASLAFALTGLMVAIVASVFAAIQCYYYITRKKRERWLLYWLGAALLILIVVAIIVNATMLRGSGGTIDYGTLRYFTTLLQSFIAISVFTAFNIVFMYAWTCHLKKAGVNRIDDSMINVVDEQEKTQDTKK